MLIANHSQLGESANELVKKWGTSGYRYGFPDYYAYGPPVRPMMYDQSRVYQGVIGRHYPEAETARYHYLYDPNMYQQPGFGDPSSTGQAIAILENLLAVAPADASFSSFDVVWANNTATGAGIDGVNKLWIIHGHTFEQVRQATAAAGGTINATTATGDLARRIARSRASTDSTIANATIGKVDDVRAAVENMIEVLRSGNARPVTINPIILAKGPWPTGAKIAVAGAGVLALGTLATVLLMRR
jgi:hypothetical protein